MIVTLSAIAEFLVQRVKAVHSIAVGMMVYDHYAFARCRGNEH